MQESECIDNYILLRGTAQKISENYTHVTLTWTYFIDE